MSNQVVTRRELQSAAVFLVKEVEDTPSIVNIKGEMVEMPWTTMQRLCAELVNEDKYSAWELVPIATAEEEAD